MVAQACLVDAVQDRVRALVVDDVGVNRRVMHGFLSAEGIDVHEAANAGDAMALLSVVRFDLVVLDLELEPGADGFSVLEFIRARPDLDLVPVIVVSGHHIDEESVERGLLSGADDYVTRPVASGVLRARIVSAVRSRARVRGLSQQAALATRSASEALGELRAAKEVQRSTLPKVPLRGGRFAISGAVVPAGDIAGDSFDVFYDDQGNVTAYVMDAAGHGPASGLVVSAARQALSASLSRGAPIEQALADLEACLFRHDDCLQAAVAVGIVRFRFMSREVEVVNAGLPPIAVCTPDGSVELVPSASLSIGLAPIAALHPTVKVLTPGSTWMLVSDGLTDGDFDADALEATLSRLALSKRGAAWANADATTFELMMREVIGANADSPLSDDASLLVAHLLETVVC